MKETKSPTTRRRRISREAEETTMPLIEKPERIIQKLKKAKILSTEYEGRIKKICSKNKYPFAFKGGSVGRKMPDFINRKRKLIIEIYNPERSEKEKWERVTTFNMHSYKFIVLTRHDLTRADWERFCMGAIKGFLG